ncbi:hypothetical protein [Dactylosporangium matsuzakiense]|uniref:Uncharacterized protein n=1 Tax=Dactylosporangium matsuzakiense TaxID=53360 RepID=A0A9W6KNK5_9ACTN|nr:hypothetical protein [Dactylosporangium matsuzakiense]UWZ44579.1 hypothetical protein Dmats_45780 [Dactylosporangium matsuzakiense]GLL05341.1 hypothetical protein GCM10017581_070880 [Dactylosporangium matsuzakiense]
MSELAQGESRDLFSHCPSGCVCGVRELVARQAEQGERPADEVDAAEMRSLLVAVRDGYETVRSDPRLVDRRHTATARYDRAERHLNYMRTNLADGRVGRAAQEVARTEAAAAEGRRRPGWLRKVRWPAVIGIGFFDVWYFSQVFRFLTSRTGDAAAGGTADLYSLLETLAAVVPGLVLALIVAASADLLLRPLRAWKAAAFTKPEELVADVRPSRGRRALRGLGAVGRWILRLAWWSLPVVFVGFVLFVLAIWAGLRTKYSAAPVRGYPHESVMILLLLLAVGTMAVKILADDEAADHLSQARRRMRWQRIRYQALAFRADRLIGAYDSAWRDLRTLRDDLVGLLRIKMLSAWEGFILRVRSLHRMAGNVTAAPWPLTGQPGAYQEFEGVPQPALELGPLLEICRLIDERHPDRLRNMMRAIGEEYSRQVSNTPVMLIEVQDAGTKDTERAEPATISGPPDQRLPHGAE